jgi:hypothetical protein
MKMHSFLGRFALVFAAAFVAAWFAGCGSGSATEDSSASGAAAGSIGAAIAASGSTGTTSRSLRALTPCPTLKTAAGSGCAAGPGTTVNLTYDACSFGSSTAKWTGTLEVGVTGSGNTITCGSFPFNGSSTGTITRQFVDGGNNPQTGTRTSSFGTVVTIDHHTANLGNYEGDTIAANVGTGYGDVVTWTGGKRTGIQVRQRVYSSLFDHSVNGSVTISESSGIAASNRTVTGSVDVYHNKLKVKGTSTFNNVVYVDTCCNPTSGSISTAFAKTSQSGTVGAALDGKTETLTFTGCGTATFVDYKGTSSNVTLSHCL